MSVFIPDLWLWFLVCMAVFFITTYFMSRQSQHFYLQGVVRMKFSIFDMEFPGGPKALYHLIRNIMQLPGDEPVKVRKALRANLYLDFLFMPAAYIAIFLLCMHTSYKMEIFGKHIFAALAWLQVAPWLFDIIENLYLLNKIALVDRYPAPQDKEKHPAESAPIIHRAYVGIVLAKWAISCTGAVCAIFGSMYFWMVGNYSKSSMIYLLVFLLEIIVFVLMGKLAKGKRIATQV